MEVLLAYWMFVWGMLSFDLQFISPCFFFNYWTMQFIESCCFARSIFLFFFPSGFVFICYLTVNGSVIQQISRQRIVGGCSRNIFKVNHISHKRSNIEYLWNQIRILFGGFVRFCRCTFLGWSTGAGRISIAHGEIIPTEYYDVHCPPDLFHFSNLKGNSSPKWDKLQRPSRVPITSSPFWHIRLRLFLCFAEKYPRLLFSFSEVSSYHRDKIKTLCVGVG